MENLYLDKRSLLNLVQMLFKIKDEFILIFGIFLVVMLCEYILGPKSKVDLKQHLLNIIGAILLIFIGSLLMFNLQANLPYPPLSTCLIENKYLYALVFVLLNDFIYYIYHRLQHSWPPLWKFHQFHHTEPNMNVLTSHRTHLLERPLQTLIVAFPVYLILGFNLEAFKIIMVVSLFFLIYGHINIKIPHYFLTKVFVGPCYHRIHHSIEKEEHNSNFAQVFPLFDIIFNTYKAPSNKMVITGVRGSKSYQSQIKSMLWPLAGRSNDE